MDPQEEIRRAIRDLFDELVRVADQAGKMMRQAADDAQRWVTPADAEHPHTPAEPPPFATIRELGKLRDDGLITEEEFQAKKAQLLESI
jgi:hypothetical protein